MNRRLLLKEVGVVALYSSFPSVLSEFISSCNTKEKKLRAGFFSDDEFQLVEQLTDTMFPKTATPGALEIQLPYFIGACMVSTACQNPSLTYMALTARACDYAVTQLKKGEIK